MPPLVGRRRPAARSSPSPRRRRPAAAAAAAAGRPRRPRAEAAAPRSPLRCSVVVGRLLGGRRPRCVGRRWSSVGSSSSKSGFAGRLLALARVRASARASCGRRPRRPLLTSSPTSAGSASTAAANSSRLLWRESQLPPATFVLDRVEQARSAPRNRSCGIVPPSSSDAASREREGEQRTHASRAICGLPGIAASLDTGLAAAGGLTGPRRAAARGAPAGRRRRSRRPPGRCRTRLGGRSPVQAVGVELEPGGARVAVARLADAARVDQPAAAADLQARPGRRLGAARVGLAAVAASSSASGEEQRHVRVADEAHPARLDPDALGGLVGPEHVLPDRVARRGVVEGDLAPRRPGSRPSQELRSSPRSSPRGSSAPRPPRPGRRSRCRARPSAARSWLPTRQIEQRSRDERRRTRPAARRSRRRRRGTRPRSTPAPSISARTASSAGRLEWMSLRIASAQGADYRRDE